MRLLIHDKMILRLVAQEIRYPQSLQGSDLKSESLALAPNSRANLGNSIPALEGFTPQPYNPVGLITRGCKRSSEDSF